MKHHYKDITDKLGEPQWYDEHGVPRYCDYGPGEVADIYANEVAFLEIACQGCDTRFVVAFSKSVMSMVYTNDEYTLAREIEEDVIHYGDPPNTGCCPAGPTMNSVPIRVLAFWKRGLDEGDEAPGGVVPKELVHKVVGFRRINELEKDISPGW